MVKVGNLPGLWGFDQSNLPEGGEFDQKICPGSGISPVSENLPRDRLGGW